MRRPGRPGPGMALALALALALVACAETQTGSGPPERRVVAREWDVAFTVGGAADTTLADIGYVAAGADRVIVYDEGRRTIVGFDTTGAVTWRVGREGRGPNEFSNIRAVVLSPDGRVAALDRGNGRISLIEDGAIIRRIPIVATGPSDGMIVGRERFTLVANGDPPLLEIDRDGASLGGHGYPHVVADVDGMATQPVIAGTPDAWALAFVFGGGWIASPTGRFEDAYYRDLVADPGFPVVESTESGSRLVDAEKVVEAISLSGDTVFIHGYDRSEKQGYLDLFALEDGEYLGSWRLPPPAARAYRSSVSGEFVAIVEADPSPTLIVYRR